MRQPRSTPSDLIDNWWRGRRAAAPLDPDWLSESGIKAPIVTARQQADQKHNNGFWLVGSADRPSVLISRRTSRAGQEPILGHGCDPDPGRAAAKTLCEILLMEVNLMERLAMQEPGMPPDPQEDRIDALVRHGCTLLSGEENVRPGMGMTTPEDPVARFVAPLHLRDIKTPEGPIAVWLCRPDPPVPDFPVLSGAPFL